MKEKYEDCLKQKFLAITTDTLIVGMDIAKSCQWARFVDFRGIERVTMPYSLKTVKAALRPSYQGSGKYANKENFAEAVVGMELTGHY